MGNRGSISVFNQETGNESVVLFRHHCGDWQGMKWLIEEAIEADNEKVFSRKDPHEIIAHLCAISVKQIGGITTYLGKEQLDGDNSDNGHFQLVLNEEKMCLNLAQAKPQTEWYL